MSELEFKTMIIRLLPGLQKKSREDTRESLSAEIKELKFNQAEFKNDIAEMQTQMEAIKNEDGRSREVN